MVGGEGLVKYVSFLHSLSLHTPCHVQDPGLAEQVLSDNSHDVDLAIVELLQLMDLDQGKILASLISLHLSLYTGSAFLPHYLLFTFGVLVYTSYNQALAWTCHLINSFSN